MNEKTAGGSANIKAQAFNAGLVGVKCHPPTHKTHYTLEQHTLHIRQRRNHYKATHQPTQAHVQQNRPTCFEENNIFVQFFEDDHHAAAQTSTEVGRARSKEPELL
jgi:hypothetical protein